MKKRFLPLVILLSCGTVTYALPVGNPADASLLTQGIVWEGYSTLNFCDPALTCFDALSMRIGFYGDYVFNRHLKVGYPGLPRRIEHCEIFTNAALLSANFCDYFALYATLGTTNFRIKSNVVAFQNGTPVMTGTPLEIVSETEFSWSLAARATLFDWRCFSCGMEGQYFFTRPDIIRVTEEFESEYLINLESKYRDWQIGAGISARLNYLSPYVALKWSQARIDMQKELIDIPGADEVELYDLKNTYAWGVAFGVTLINCEMISLTIEGRWLDEKAVHTNAQIRF